MVAALSKLVAIKKWAEISVICSKVGGEKSSKAD
jgi:hypothetical protein